MDASKCFLCPRKFKPAGLIGELFFFWRTNFNFATVIVLADGNLGQVFIPLCDTDFEYVKKNKVVAMEMIRSKLVAQGYVTQ